MLADEARHNAGKHSCFYISLTLGQIDGLEDNYYLLKMFLNENIYGCVVRHHVHDILERHEAVSSRGKAQFTGLPPEVEKSQYLEKTKKISWN